MFDHGISVPMINADISCRRRDSYWFYFLPQIYCTQLHAFYQSYSSAVRLEILCDNIFIIHFRERGRVRRWRCVKKCLKKVKVIVSINSFGFFFLEKKKYINKRQIRSNLIGNEWGPSELQWTRGMWHRYVYTIILPRCCSWTATLRRISVLQEKSVARGRDNGDILSYVHVGRAHNGVHLITADPPLPSYY